MSPARHGRLRWLADRRNRQPETTGPAPEELASQPGGEEITPIGQARPRQRVTVMGEVRTVALRPREDVPALDIELWDGVDALHLVWLGRRSIAGITPGTWLRATGRVTIQRRAVTIFNPAYEVVGRARETHG